MRLILRMYSSELQGVPEMKSQKESEFLKFFNRHFHVIIYCCYFFILLFFLYKAGLNALLLFPERGSEEFCAVQSAFRLHYGLLPSCANPFSFFYTFYIYILLMISYGDPAIMKLIQAAICSFIPVYIYLFAKRLRFGRENAQIAAFLYCFYGASALMSLSFFYSSIFTLFFLLFVYFTYKAFMTRHRHDYVLGGIFAALLLLGRINALPILLVPVLFIAIPTVKRRISPGGMIFMLISFLSIFLPFLFCDIYGLGQNIILSGSYHFPPSSFYSSGNIPLYSMISSYEIPLSISYYTFTDILPFTHIFIIPFNLIFVLALLSLFIYRKRYAVYLILFTVLCYFAAVLYSENYFQFRTPVVPLLCVLAGGTVHAVRERYPKMISGLLLIFTALLCFLTYIDADLMRGADEKRDVARILIDNNRFEEATKYLDNLERSGIPATDQWSYLITSIAATGDVQWALEVEYIFVQYIKKRNKRRVIVPVNPYDPRNQ